MRRILVFVCPGFVAFFQTNGGLSFGDLVLRFSLAALAGLLLGDLERGLMYFRLLLPRELPSLLLVLCKGDSLFLFTVIDLLWFLGSSPAWFPLPQSGTSSSAMVAVRLSSRGGRCVLV